MARLALLQFLLQQVPVWFDAWDRAIDDRVTVRRKWRFRSVIPRGFFALAAKIKSRA